MAQQVKVPDARSSAPRTTWHERPNSCELYSNQCLVYYNFYTFWNDSFSKVDLVS